MSIVLTSWRLRQEDCCAFETSLSYDVRPCFKTNIKGANRTAQPVKSLACKTGDLSSIPGPYMLYFAFPLL